MEIKLKNCPICGREVKVCGGTENWKPTFYDPDSGGEPYFIDCECGLRFGIGSRDYKEFTDSWNNRVEQGYKQLDIKVGDERYIIIENYMKRYLIEKGTCKKISKYNNNPAKYTFEVKETYKTYTYVEKSFGRKVFNSIEEAEKGLNKLNKME